MEEGREDKVSSAYHNLQPEDTEYLCAVENSEEGTEVLNTIPPLIFINLCTS